MPPLWPWYTAFCMPCSTSEYFFGLMVMTLRKRTSSDIPSFVVVHFVCWRHLRRRISRPGAAISRDCCAGPDIYMYVQSNRKISASGSLRNLLSVSASQVPVFRRYPINGQIDQNETWAQEVLTYDLIFRNMLLLQKIKIPGSCHWP